MEINQEDIQLFCLQMGNTNLENISLKRKVKELEAKLSQMEQSMNKNGLQVVEAKDA